MSKYITPTNFTQVQAVPERNTDLTLASYSVGFVPSQLSTAEINQIAADRPNANALPAIVYDTDTNAFTGIDSNGAIVTFGAGPVNAAGYGGFYESRMGNAQAFDGNAASVAKINPANSAWTDMPLFNFVSGNNSTTMTSNTGTVTQQTIGFSASVQTDIAGAVVSLFIRKAGVEVGGTRRSVICGAAARPYPINGSQIMSVGDGQAIELWGVVDTGGVAVNLELLGASVTINRA